MVHCLAPFPHAASMVGGDVAQGQPDQFGGRIIIGEVTSGLDDLAQLTVQAFNGVGGVDQLAYGRWESEERDHPIPGAAPGGHDVGKALTPRACFKLVKGMASIVGIDGRVDGLEGRGQRFAVFPARIVQAVADQVNNASLQGRGREHRAQGLRYALEAVRDGNQDVGHAAGLEVVEAFIQNLAPSVFSIHSPRMSREPSGSTPRAR